MWRIQKLTELFGVSGIDWKIEQEARWTEALPSGETAVFCEVKLFIRQEDGQWSAPTHGTGGDWIAVDTKKEYLRVSPDRMWVPAGQGFGSNSATLFLM